MMHISPDSGDDQELSYIKVLHLSFLLVVAFPLSITSKTSLVKDDPQGAFDTDLEFTIFSACSTPLLSTIDHNRTSRCYLV